jgi:glycosyltransferase involved in cell wall biosynthesis
MMVTISVVIPTYNRPMPLRRCLNELAKQRIDTGVFEVIVVDDGSETDVARSLSDLQLPFRLLVLRQANAGPGAARNLGVHVASGCYCLFLDDDVLPERDLVAAHRSAQNEGGGVVGVGRITTNVLPTADWFARASAESLNRGFAKLDAGEPVGWLSCYSGNLSVPRDAFLAEGGFVADLPRCEDIELGFRLERSGVPLRYIPTARVLQLCEKDRSDLARDLERAGEAAVELSRRHDAMRPALLGRFARGWGSRRRRLLRAVLAVGLPSAACDVVARAVWSETDSRRRERFLHQVCFWRGVRRALRGDHDTWRRLTHGAGSVAIQGGVE